MTSGIPAIGITEGLIRIRSASVAAVTASMLTAVHHMIANGTFHQDLGADHFDRNSKPAQIKRLLATLQNLGYAVEIKPLAA